MISFPKIDSTPPGMPPGGCEPPLTVLLRDVEAIMDMDRDAPLWRSLFEAIFYDIELVSWACLDPQTHLYKATLAHSYMAKHDYESDAMHYPKEITLRLDRIEDRIYFPGNTHETKTAFYGTRDMWFFTAVGASQWVEYDEAGNKFVTLAHTNVAFHHEEYRSRTVEDAIDKWRNRPRTITD
ncbi:MAG: hypothetical protein KDK78_07465 [Chlamydiia bacterium]|nr:hypothetical protein [Chlamydiia bacterium]